MTKKTHKNQHFVPACYLKAWCDPTCSPLHEPYVWLFDKDGNNARRKAPSNIFAETDLYTIKKADGSRDLRLEHGLNELETKFTRIRNSKFNFRRDLTLEERVYLAAFVGAAQFRTPANRDHHAEQWGRVAKMGDEMMAAMAKKTPGERAAAASILPSSGGRSFTHEQVKEIATAPLQTMMEPMLSVITPLLARMDMAVFCTDDPVGFLTSDHPCIWFDPEAYKLPPFYRGPALGSKTIEVTMPISPSQCLYLNLQGFKGYLSTPKVVLDEFNRRHRALCHDSYVLRSNEKRDAWFYEPPIPDDAWDNVYEREYAAAQAAGGAP